jgi:phospholipase/lecithinase/hemolysin
LALGILGDSGSDEYRADDNRGGLYRVTTLGWNELLNRYRGLDFGSWGTRAEPRRSGYEYNWARTGYRVQDMINSGQHTGLAAQVAAGKVSHVYIQIGINDFAPWNGTYDEIYNGTLNTEQIAAKNAAIVNNLVLAIDTLQAAGPVKIVVANVADRGAGPAVMYQYPDPAKRLLVTNAVAALDADIATMAASHQVAVLDLFNFGNSLMSGIDQNGNYLVGSQLISLITFGDEPHHAILGDTEHSGTVFSGILANAIMEKFNAAYGTDVPFFSSNELLLNAGITP